MNRCLRIFFHSGKRTAVIVCAILATIIFAEQLQTDIYDFQQPAPFNGNSIYNPYDSVTSHWYKANFHAHSRSYLGLTYGTQKPSYMIAKYRTLEYQIINISDYFSIQNNSSNQDLFTDVYEHGCNLFKTHRLVIGASSVDYFDFLVHPVLSNKQYMLHRLRSSAEIVAVAHPEFGNGHTADDLKYLTGYDCLEVLNHLRVSTTQWDSALSAGKAVWLLAYDDSHNSASVLQCGRTWTMVNGRSMQKDEIFNAIRRGSTYGVRGMFGENVNAPVSVTVRDSTATITFADTIDAILAIVQGGRVKKSVLRSISLECQFSREDRYMRFEARSGDNQFAIYMNPLIWRDGTDVPRNTFTASVNMWKSVLWKGLISLLYCAVMIGLFYRRLVVVWKLTAKKFTPDIFPYGSAGVTHGSHQTGRESLHNSE